MIKLPGFPTQISEEIELPDMAELLTYPFFFDTDIEDAYAYGSDFQKKLLDSIPNLGKNGKRNISVLSEVRFLAPTFRSCTGSYENHDVEWHIDCEENEDGPHIFHEPRDIVHLLTNETTSMTEFLEEELILEMFNENTPYEKFSNYFHQNFRSLNPKTRRMPSNRIVTFTNHPHRATDPTRYEFKYMFRVVETDRVRPCGRYNPQMNASTVIGLDNVPTTNIIRQGGQITIFIPGMEYGEPQFEIPSPMVNIEDTHPENSVPFKTMEISMVGWEASLTSENGTLRGFSPKNSIMVINKGNYMDAASNRNLLQFFQKMSKKVQLVGEDGTVIQGRFDNDFYDVDDKLGHVAGAHILFPFSEFNKLKAGVKYRIEVDKSNGYYYEIPEDLTFELRMPKLLK